MTTLQKQCILAYFGLYSGELDGKWGPLSRAATETFQRRMELKDDGVFGPATEAAARKIIGSGEPLPNLSWKGIRHFRREDFRCKCGGNYCNGFPAEPDLRLVEIAELAVDHFAGKIDPARDLVSGLRCTTHNRNEGGVSGSRHLTGKAMDLRVPGIPAAELLAFVKKQPIRYAYAINGTNVHFDVL